MAREGGGYPWENLEWRHSEVPPEDKPRWGRSGGCAWETLEGDVEVVTAEPLNGGIRGKSQCAWQANEVENFRGRVPHG